MPFFLNRKQGRTHTQQEGTKEQKRETRGLGFNTA